jgi:hypothetical protein
MKQRIKTSAMILIGMSAAVFFGCENLIQSDIAKTENTQPADVNLNYTADDFNSAFAKAAFFTVKSAADSLEAVKNAGVDFDAIETAARSAAGFQFSDLGAYLKNSRTRNAAEEPDELDAELSEIASIYKESLSALIPSPEPAVNAGLLVIEDGAIVISDDQSIPLDSLDGIATVEVLNRVAAGERMEDVIAEIQADIEKLIEENQSETRGLFIKPENSAGIGGATAGARWAYGLVRYYFETGEHAPSGKAKETARSAMREWNIKTGGKVRFQEIDPNAWDYFSTAIGQNQHLKIGVYSDLGPAGKSSIGTFSLFAEMKIKSAYAETSSRVWLHEIGHTLGLLHEHQRYDRDDYVTVNSSDTTNYGKIPKQTLVAGLKPVRILFVTIYLPYIWYMDYGKTVGAFDFDSIMLYWSPNIYRKTAVNGNREIQCNTVLSSTDIATIRYMY